MRKSLMHVSRFPSHQSRHSHILTDSCNSCAMTHSHMRLSRITRLRSMSIVVCTVYCVSPCLTQVHEVISRCGSPSRQATKSAAHAHQDSPSRAMCRSGSGRRGGSKCVQVEEWWRFVTAPPRRLDDGTGLQSMPRKLGSPLVCLAVHCDSSGGTRVGGDPSISPDARHNIWLPICCALLHLSLPPNTAQRCQINNRACMACRLAMPNALLPRGTLWQ